MILPVMKYFNLLILIFLCIVAPAFAEPQTGFREAVITAFENNNEFRALKNNLSAKKMDIGIEKSKLLPHLGFEENFISTNNPADSFALRLNQKNAKAADLELKNLQHPREVNNFLTGIYLEQTLFDRKKIVNLSIAKTEFSSQFWEYLRKRDEIVKKVAINFYNVDKAKKLVSAAEKNVEESQENLNLVQLKYNNKKELYSAVLRATTVLNNAKQALVSSKKNLMALKRALGLVLGKQEMVDTTENNSKSIPFMQQNYYNDASIERNDIKSMELKYQNSKNNIKLAEADYFPKIGVLSSYRFYSANAPFGGQGDNYFVSAFVTWEIFDGLKRRDTKSKSELQAMEIWEILEGLKKEVSFQVFDAFLTAEEKKENIQISEDTLKTAEEGRKRVFKRYKESVLDVTDLLNTQTNLNLARANYISQENDYVNALINLSFVSGTIIYDLGI